MDVGNLNSFAGLFFEDQNEEILRPFKNLEGSGFLDVDFENNYLFANGFIIPGNDSSYLEVFDGQRPVTTNFADFVPGNTAKVFYQSFSDPALWYRNTMSYWESNSSSEFGEEGRDKALEEFDIDRMLTWAGSQIVRIDLEAIDEPGKLLLIESNDVYESLNQLSRVTEKVNFDNNDTLYYEEYGEITIRLLNLNEFPSQILGDWYNGFPVTYYTVIDPFLILSNDVEPIKTLIADREAENTWGQSVSKSEFIDNSLDESNFGILVNTPKVWNHALNSLANYWKDGWMKYARSIKQIEMSSLQVSNSAGKFYSSLVLKNRGGITRDISVSGANQILATGTGSRITNKPKVVRNHRDGTWEVLLIDSMNQLTLMDRNGRFLWQQFLDGPAGEDIYQVDFYKNRKLQYLLSTDSLLHIIDRNGEIVEGYPQDVSDIAISEMSVVDYDNSKNYRFMLAQPDGTVYLLNKEGDRLEGWDPKDFSGRFLINPFHLRVRGRDVFLGIKENEEVIATNRRGEMINGFPLDLDTRIGGEVFYQVKSGFDKTYITAVSEEGEIIQFNLEGKIRDRVQLYKPASDTRFWLVKDGLRKTFVIARQDLNRLAILDREGEVLFEKDYLSSEPFGVQYYNFGAGQDMIIVSNAVEGKVLIYDDTGTLIVPELASDFPVSIVHYESRSQYHVYTASADSLYIHSIQE